MPHLRQTDKGRAIVSDDISGAVIAHFENSAANAQPGTSRVVMSKFGTLARTDTAAKNLFTLPAGAIPVACASFWGTNSNAGTTGTISVGKAGGTGAEFASAINVKTGNNTLNPHSSSALYSALAADTVITGTYAETGTASSAGGPFNVRIDYYVP